MSAPATSHDLRCGALTDPSIPCNCARGAAVVRLPVGNVRDCLMCGRLPAWEIRSADVRGDRRVDRSCRACLDPVLDSICRDRWDGFAPITVTPLTARGGIT